MNIDALETREKTVSEILNNGQVTRYENLLALSRLAFRDKASRQTATQRIRYHIEHYTMRTAHQKALKKVIEILEIEITA